MNKVKITLIILGLLLLQIKPAAAFDLGGYMGPLKFKFTDFSDGATAPFLVPGYGHADTVEDAFGIFKVSTINADDFASTLLWFDGKNGEELTGMYYNIDDDLRDLVGFGGLNIQSVGGQLDIYLDSTPDFNAALGPAGRTGTSTFPTVTDGTPFLNLVMVPGVKYGDFIPANDYIVYNNDFNGTTTPFSGGGLFFADVTGGSWSSTFDSNAICMTDDSGVNHCTDFLGQFDTTTVGAGPWLVKSEDPVSGTAIPEPATMFLLGSGLVGMIGTRLRKQKV